MRSLSCVLVGRWENISTTVAFAEGYRDIIGKLFPTILPYGYIVGFFFAQDVVREIPKGEGEIYEKIINPYPSSNAIT